MLADFRNTSHYREAQALYTRLLQPGSGQISDLTDVHASRDGTAAVFTGTLADKLEGELPTRICRTDLSSGDTRVLTFGPNLDRCPRFSPDGRIIAFLSDRHRAGDFQLYLLDLLSGAARSTSAVDGWVEYLHWSPDGSRILLGVAGHGADIAGGQGAIASRPAVLAAASWMPTVETGEETYRWRRAWVYELASNRVRCVSAADVNVWEAVWCGNEAVAAVISPGPEESLWYSARLAFLNIREATAREVYASKDQLGRPAGSPSGRSLAVVEAVCSDRGIVAGELRIIDSHSGHAQRVDTASVDVTYTEWSSDRRLLLAGHRGHEAVVGVYDSETSRFTQLWASQEISGAGRYLCVSGLDERGDCTLAGEGFTRAPELAVIRGGQYRTIRSFDVGYAAETPALEAVREVRWPAPDGLAIHGLLLLPRRPAPHPIVMVIHGGPVWHWHPMYLGRPRTLPFLLLLQRGYALFLPNPRGSSGRGSDFARKIKGDLNGADTQDFLAGLDHLVELGIADARLLGVTGISYGGCMTSWLITQDTRFAAAVSVAPHTNQVSAHLLSNIPHFFASFLEDRYDNAAGKYFARSPIMHARKAITPTLNICGALDRCTPPVEAAQFHHALREQAVESVLVTYPEEGHGIHQLPAAIDYAARLVAWFEEHMVMADCPSSAVSAMHDVQPTHR